MKPLKNLYPLATWLMRLTLVFYVYTAFFSTFLGFNFSSQWFYLSVVYLLAVLFLFAGGLVSRHHITVISALVLLLATLYQIIFLVQPIQYLTHRDMFLVAAMSLFFISKGNQ